MTGWSGDFGNSLSVTEVLARVEPFIGIVEAERHNPEVSRDDVMQEARIAVWRAIDKKPADMRTYLIGTIKRRTTSAVTRQDWTGRPSRQGKQTPDALSAAEPLETALLLAAGDLLEAVEWAYHRGEVLDALSRLPLPQREYVYMRFWLGMTEAEIAAVKDTTKARENALWNRTIRPTLAQSLAHLG